jgi:hypothetical protein
VVVTVTAATVAVLATIGAAALALRAEYAGETDPVARTRGRDAVWLGHAWVDGRRTMADVDALAARVRGTGVRDLYVHAGPLDVDGRLDPARYARAGWAIRALRSAIPGVRIQAWLGQRVGKGALDLDAPATRGSILASARQVLDAGFDGVHYNFEPVPDGDRGLLALLGDTAAIAHPLSAVVSMSCHQVEPLPGMNAVDDVLVGRHKWWTPGYLRQVARRVDQVAIMSYDTALPVRSLYGGYVRRQTEVALRAVPQKTDLLMGLPAFHTDDLGHHASAETVGAAVRGVRLALGHGSRQSFGVAMYVDFAAIDLDWSAYRRGWGAE